MKLRVISVALFSVAVLAQPAVALEVFGASVAYQFERSGSSIVRTSATFESDSDAAEVTTELVSTTNGVTVRSETRTTAGDSGIVLRAGSSASGTATQANGGLIFQGSALSGFTDHVVINGDGLTGTAGSFQVRLNYDGSLSGVAGGGFFSSTAFGVVCEGYAGCANDSPQLGSTFLGGVNGFSDGAQSVAGSGYLGQINFVFGTPFDLSVYLAVNALVEDEVGDSASAIADFMHTATVGSFTVRDATGARVAGASVNSVDASHHYAVPEPSTWALLITGFGMAGAGLRRRRRSLAV